MKYVFLLLILFPLHIFSQQVIFCESVDHSGVAKNASKEFTIRSGGGLIKILVKLSNEAGSSLVVFDIYKLNNGKEIFDNTVRMEIQPAVTWFYKEITFFKGGNYLVYVYDEKDKLLGLGEVKIKLR